MTNSSHLPDTDKALFWDQHYSQWQSSGLSQKSYCREHSLSHRQFMYWRTRHNRLQLAQAIPVAAIPVDLEQPSAYAYSPQINTGRYSIELQLGKAVLKLPPDTSPQYVAQLLSALT